MTTVFRRRPQTAKEPVQPGALFRNWNLLPRAFRYVRPYKGKGTATIALTILLALAAIAEPWPLAFVVDTVLHDKPPPGWMTSLVGDGQAGLIVLGAVGILLIALVVGGLTVAHDYVSTSLDLRMVLDLRSELFRHMLRLPPTFHEDRPTGRLMYQLNDEPDSLGHVVLAIPEFAQSGLTMLGMLFIAFRIDIRMTLLCLTIIPFVAWSTTYFANRIEAHARKTRRLEVATISIVLETITMIRVIVTYGREAHEHRRFRDVGEKAVDARVKLTMREGTFRLVVNFLTAAGTAAVLGFGAYEVVQGHISTGELLVFLAYVTAVYDPLKAFTNKMAALQQLLMALKAMFRMLDTVPSVLEKPDAIDVGRTTGRISFEDVAFSYATRKDTLRSISFTVEAGQALALVGPTGAGKSTLVSLLPRHLEPSQGRITIDGIDVRDMTLESLRAQFSIVLQEPLLFSGTIKENIAYGRVGASDDEIEQAARDANAHDFICRLPEGYDTPLGERGAKVSGGERQRIAVARAFLRDAPVLILDEPTSSIDSRTEAVILEALERLMQGRTTIMIAHRLSTIRSVDKVLVLHEGRLVDSGTHDELLEHEGLYRELWEAQTQQRRRIEAARGAISVTSSS